jgi:hypothetical protein
MDTTKFGIAWYRPDQWDRLREISSDRDKLDKTYNAWLKSAEEMLMRFHTEGFEAVRYEVDVEELLNYCKERKLQVNGSSRSQYVTEMLLKQNP